jgi:hypothetical protein
MTILKIQAGRVITQTLNTFIGQEGTLFYDPSTGELRLSDGRTPGGKSIANVAVALQGNTLTNTVTSIDFVGAGVNATTSGNSVTVTIEGGGGGTTEHIGFNFLLAGM